MSVTLSSGVRKALTSLQSTAAAAQQTQFRLATGKKVNSALDSPASFFTAAGLSNRASDLSRLLDNMGQAVKTLEAADKGIKGITKLVENAQSLAKQAEAATADSVATAAELTSTPVTGAFADNDKITFRVNGTNREVTFLSTDDTLAEFATAITAATDISATVSGSDIKIYTDTATGTAASLSVVSASSAAVLTKLGLTVGAADSGDAAVTRRADLAKEFNALRTQIDQLATDAGYNGVNLLNGDGLTVAFNENSSSKLNIVGTNGKASGIGITASAGNWADNGYVAVATAELKAASDKLRSQASSFGANLAVVQNRQDFTQNLISTLTEGSDALTSADSNQEAANLLALQTRTQLSQTALSLSSQADQGVLRLF